MALILGLLFAVASALVYELFKGDISLAMRIKLTTASVVIVLFSAALLAWRFSEALAAAFLKTSRPMLQKAGIVLKARRRAAELRRLWIQYVIQGNDSRTWKLRLAVQAEYFSEEIRDLSGAADLDSRRLEPPDPLNQFNQEGLPLIVTNFPRYASLVTEAINTALSSCSDGMMVFCFTTLSMHLEKWFNFDDRRNCVREEWSAYINGIERLVNFKREIVISRVCLVGREGDSGPEGTVNLISKKDLQAALKKQIWLSRRGGHPEGLLVPLKLADRRAVYDEMRRAYPGIAFSETEPPEREAYEAYLILEAEESVSLSSGFFSPLGREFAERYHSSRDRSKHHAYYAEVDWRSFYSRGLAPLPVDFFYISIVPRFESGTEEPRDLRSRLVEGGIFCLAAVPDEKLNMVYLHLLDPWRTPGHFEALRKHVGSLFENKEELTNLL
jgi:hypothetical protein